MLSFNSADRLKGLLEEASKQPDNIKSRSVWARIIGFDADDMVVAYDHAVSFHALIRQVHTDVESCIENDKRLPQYLGQLKKIQNLPHSFVSGNSWNHYNHHIESGVIVSLGFCCSLLEDNGLSEALVDDHLLGSFDEKVTELFRAIFWSDLPRVLKLKLTKQLNDVSRSIRHYRVHGVDGLEAAAASIAGEVGLYKKALGESEDSEDIFGKLHSFFGAFIKIAENANHAFQLLENFKGVMKLGAGE